MPSNAETNHLSEQVLTKIYANELLMPGTKRQNLFGADKNAVFGIEDVLGTQPGQAAPGISAPIRWIVPTLLNGWVDFGAGYQGARYAKNYSGLVSIEGLIKSGAGAVPVFTLPPRYRPLATLVFPILANGLLGVLEVRANGDVVITVGSSVNSTITCSFQSSQ